MSSVSEGVPSRCEEYSGLIVETVTPGSAALQAGLQPRDRLVSYDSKLLSSPASLLALEENTFGKEQVLLQIEREGAVLERFVPIGMLGVEVRPELPLELLTQYEAGRERFQSGAFVEAAQQWQKAAEQSSDAAIAAWLYSRAGAAWERGADWQQAIEAYEGVWEFLKASEDTAVQSRTAMALGRCHQNRSEWEKAIGWYSAAVEVDQKAGHEIWQARGINNLGDVANDRGNLQAAEDYFTRAAQIRERLAPDSLHVAGSLTNLGRVAAQLGDLEAAQDYFVRSLHINEQLAPNSRDVAGCLSNLGILAKERGDLQMALDCYTRSLQIQEHLAPNSLDMAHSLHNLGVVARLRGDLQAAQDYYLRALQIKERYAPNSLDLATSLNNLGNVVSQLGDPEAARHYHTRALHIKEHLAPDSLYLAHSLGNLGELVHLQGDLEAAQGYHTRALQIRERLAPDSIDVAASLSCLGFVAIHRGDLGSAQGYLTHALQIRERLTPHSLDCAEALTHLGWIHLQLQQPHLALPLLLRTTQIVEQQRATIASPEARALLLAQHTSKYANLIQCHLALNTLPEAFTTLERAHARSFLELLAERHIDFTADAPADLLMQQRDLDRQRAETYGQLAKLSADTDTLRQIEALHAHLRDLERKQQELTAQIRHASPRYAALQYPQPLDLQTAQEAIEPDTLALCYLVDEAQTFLFALTRKTLHAYTLPLGQKTLQQQVNSFRNALDVRLIDYSRAEARRQGRALYDLLLAPAHRQIQRARRLLLCPDAALHTLPWPALVTGAGRNLRYLGEKKPLHTTLSLTIYAQMRDRGRGKREERQITAKPAATATGASSLAPVFQTARKLLALGDPLYANARQRLTVATRSAGREEDTYSTNVSGSQRSPFNDLGSEFAALQTRGLSLQPLPHTREEVEGIGKIFGRQARIRLGRQATKTAAKAEMGTADLLHFACHGWLDAQHPLSSGLLLSQPEALGKRVPNGDNGVLQAWEIFEGVKLTAELVVLSSCQSGLGQEVRGEGLIGLTRAFGYAGARSVLVSLWEVSDASTSVFMQAFYMALKAGASKMEALQRAMETVRQHPQWDHPFYWAAFLLQGEGD